MGRQINSADYLAPAVAREISGDFRRRRALRGSRPRTLAQGVNVMVHEETTLDASMEEKANARGRSSPVKPRRWRGKLPSMG